MFRMRSLLLGVGAGVVASAAALVIFLIVSAGGGSRWTHTPLWMTPPNCTLVLHARPKGVLPPTEYEYALSLFPMNRRLDVDIPDDTSGGDPLVVYAFDASPDDGTPLAILLVDILAHAMVLDPQTG